MERSNKYDDVQVHGILYSRNPHQTVEFWHFENPEYLDYISQKRGEPKESILSGVLSFQVWRGIATYRPEWLWGAIPSPNPTSEEIERYFLDNTLILVSRTS